MCERVIIIAHPCCECVWLCVWVSENVFCIEIGQTRLFSTEGSLSVSVRLSFTHHTLHNRLVSKWLIALSVIDTKTGCLHILIKLRALCGLQFYQQYPNGRAHVPKHKNKTPPNRVR